MDLQPNRQKKVATNLLLALEENAFLLAGVIDEPTNILETQEIMSKSSISILADLDFDGNIKPAI